MALFFAAFVLFSQLATEVFTYPTFDSSHDSPTLLSRRSALGLPVANISANLPPIGFTVDIDHDTKDVDSRACFWLTLMAVADLATNPFDSTIDESWVIKKPGSGGMMLSLSGRSNPRGGFKVKYMIWGLVSAIRYMDSQDDWRNYRFTLKWQGNEIGSIIFIGGRGADDEFPTKLFINQSIAQDPNAVLDFRVGWNSPERSIPFNDVMMNLIGGFSDLALHDMDDRIRDAEYQTAFPPYEASIKLRPLTQVPIWWTYSVVYDGLSRLFEWYMEHNPTASRSAYIWILIDQKLQGEGTISIGGAQQISSTS